MIDRYLGKAIAIWLGVIALVVACLIPSVLISKEAFVFVALLLAGWTILGMCLGVVMIAYILWTEI